MKKLNVPENISLRWEAWRGVGGPELAKSSVVAVISIVATVILAKVNLISIFAAVTIVIFSFATSISVLSKLENNQSIVDYINKAIRFKNEQQSFRYKNKVEGEVIPDDEEKAN